MWERGWAAICSLRLDLWVPREEEGREQRCTPAPTHTVLSVVPSQKRRSPHPIAVQPHSNITRTPTPTHSHICTPAHTHTHTASSTPANAVLHPHRGRKAEHGESTLVSCTEPHLAESHMAVTEDSVRTRSGSFMLTHVCCSFRWAHGRFWGQGLPPLYSAGDHPGERTQQLSPSQSCPQLLGPGQPPWCASVHPLLRGAEVRPWGAPRGSPWCVLERCLKQCSCVLLSLLDSSSSSFRDTPFRSWSLGWELGNSCGTPHPLPPVTQASSWPYQVWLDFLTVLCRWVLPPHLQGNSLKGHCWVFSSLPLLGTQGLPKSRLASSARAILLPCEQGPSVLGGWAWERGVSWGWGMGQKCPRKEGRVRTGARGRREGAGCRLT